VSSGRRSARRQAVVILYQQDLLELTPQAALQRVDDAELDRYARELVLGAAGQREAIDGLLEQHVAGWSLERLGVLERSILRLATYELLWEAEVPEAVVIDEAVELAKRFCSDEAGSLVNGVLGSLAVSGRARVSETCEDTKDDQ
jgi:N utilization substance protein B